MDYDVVIIGAGPSGSTLARLLKKSFSVALIDKKTLSGQGYYKPCGGLLSSDAQKALAKFDLTLPKEILVDPQIFSVKTIDVKTGLLRHYQRFYINLNRYKFDMWLKKLIPENVEIIKDRCEDISRTDKGFAVKLRGKTITTRYVVGADGANSVVRQKLYPKQNKKMHSYIAVQQWFPESHKNPFYSCIFDPETSPCCSWSVSKDDCFIFGGAFDKNNCREMFEKQKQRLKKFGFIFGEPIKTEACTVLRPKSFSSFCMGNDGAFLIGEAGGLISPSSFEGISYAINSATDLSEALNSSKKDPNRLYRKKTRRMRIKLLLKVMKCPFMYNPFLRRLVMKSGITAIDVKR